jgi:hypothetical protein
VKKSPAGLSLGVRQNFQPEFFRHLHHARGCPAVAAICADGHYRADFLEARQRDDEGGKTFQQSIVAQGICRVR